MIENGWRWVDNEQKIDETCESQYLIVPGLFWRLLNLMGLLHFCFWKAGGVCYFAGKTLGNACEVESLMTSMIGGLQELVCSQKYNVLVVGPSMVIVFSPLVCMEELTKMWALGRPHHKRCLILAGRVDPPISPYHILNSMPSIPIKHNTCLEQPWQETTAADVWLRPLWFSPKPPDPPSKSTSTDCWAFAWDWLWATFPPCWPLLAAWGSDWSHFLNWSRSKWYCLWTSSSFLCSFFTSDHQCIQRERESTYRIFSSTDPAADLTSVNYLLRVFMYFVVMFTTWTLAIFGYLATDSKYFRACLMWVWRPVAGKTYCQVSQILERFRQRKAEHHR